jgi:hypothetical protein
MFQSIINIAAFRKGWRTFAASFLVAMLPAFLSWIGGIDWTSIGISPQVGIFLGLLFASLRGMTTTPPGKPR